MEKKVVMLFSQQVERTNKVEPQVGGPSAMQSFAILMNVGKYLWQDMAYRMT